MEGYPPYPLNENDLASTSLVAMGVERTLVDKAKTERTARAIFENMLMFEVGDEMGPNYNKKTSLGRYERKKNARGNLARKDRTKEGDEG
jgi:hypothetical protein